jgi:hypothetical protein
MGSSRLAWYEYIWKMKAEQMAALMIIAAAIPLWMPLGIPMPTSYLSTDYYKTVESIPAGGVVVIGANIYEIGGYRASRDLWGAQFTHWVRKQLKILCVVLDTTAHMAFEDVMRRYRLDSRAGGPYVYGRDWVITPYIPGEEPAMKAVALDIWKACNGRDFYGTPFEQLPMMANLHSFNDVQLTTFKAYSGTHIEMFIRQWTLASYPNVKAVASHAYEDLAYAYGKFIQGTISGARGSAEYEYLINFPGEERAKIESRNTEAFLLFACIILGAVYLNRQKARQAIKAPAKEGE